MKTNWFMHREADESEPARTLEDRTERARKIMRLALPIIGGMLSQTLMNIVDILMVGQLSDSSIAISATGYGGFAIWMIVSILTGTGAGVQAISARRMGEDRMSESGHSLTVALYLSLWIGLPLSIIGILTAPLLFPLLVADPEIAQTGLMYFTIRCLGWSLIMANFSYRGFFNGIGRPRVYFTVIWTIQLSNIAFSYLFIFGSAITPALGVTGAGVGTVLATITGTMMYALIALYYRKSHGVYRLPVQVAERKEMRRGLVRLSIPSGLTAFVSSTGFMVFMVVAGFVGITEVAATTILVNVASASFLPAVGFGMAAATMVSTALGEKRPALAHRWGVETATLAAFILGFVGLSFVVFAEPILSSFTYDENVIQAAHPVLIVLGLGLFLDAAGNVLAQALLGAGAVRSVLFWNLFGMYVIFLPGTVIGGLVLEAGIFGLWVPMFAYRALMTVMMILIFYRRRWVNIKL